MASRWRPYYCWRYLQVIFFSLTFSITHSLTHTLKWNVSRLITTQSHHFSLGILKISGFRSKNLNYIKLNLNCFLLARKIWPLKTILNTTLISIIDYGAIEIPIEYRLNARMRSIALVCFVGLNFEKIWEKDLKIWKSPILAPNCGLNLLNTIRFTA